MPSASRLRHGLALGCAGLVLAAPAAHAQGTGAGDNQYSDPFSNSATPTATPKPVAKATATPAPAPAATAAPAVTAVPASATPAPAATPVAPQLPYTGVNAWPLFLAGALSLGSGVALRLRVR